MSSSVLSQLALDDVVDGSSPDLTSIPHSRASKKPRANHSVAACVVETLPVRRWFLSAVPPSPVGPLGEADGAGS